MIVPLLLEYVTSEDLRDSRSFFYFCRIALEENAPMIIKEDYLNRIKRVRHSIKHNDDYVRRGYRRIFDVNADVDMDEITFYQFPLGLEQRLMTENNDSINDLYASLLSTRSEILEEWFEEVIDTIEKKQGEKIEAFYTVLSSSLESIEHVAARRGIKLMFYDWGTFRAPVYYNNRLLDYHPFLSEEGVRSRYENFLSVSDDLSYQYLSRKQMLALLLDPSHLDLLDFYEDSPDRELGVATGYSSFMPLSAKSRFDDEELMYRAYTRFKKSQVLVRLHPNDPAKSSYAIQAVEKDKSKTSTEFILRCKEIASLASNVSMEAAYWNRGGYAIFDSHVSYQCKRNLEDASVKEVPDSFLNFYAFCYNVPAIFWEDLEYIHWRLSEPSEAEIFNKHLSYWLELHGVDEEMLSLPEEESIEAIIAARRQSFGFVLPASLQSLSSAQIVDKAAAYQRLSHSRIWKVLAPVRAMLKRRRL